MDPRPHDPATDKDPLSAVEPLPPGSDAAEVVDAIDERIREHGSDEVEEADEAADVAESDSDPESDPTDDGSEADTPA